MKGSQLSTRTAAPATTAVTCVTLNPGVAHEIVRREPIATTIQCVAQLYASGHRYAPVIQLKNGQARKLIISKLTQISNTLLVFEATIANGNDLVKVTVRFTGASGHAGTLTLA